MKKRCTFDFETRSIADLKKVGAYKYSLHPSTRATCLAFKIRGGKVWLLGFHVVNERWEDLPQKFREMWLYLIENGYLFVAHNAFFERCIYFNILVARLGWPKIPVRRLRCTAAKAAACALPRNLEGAGEAIRLDIQKDKRGYNAMMATCKPTKQWSAWTKARAEIAAGKRVGPKKLKLAEKPEPPVFLTPESAPEVFETLYTYCKIDVQSEEELDVKLPDLIPQEQEVWHLNQKMNWRGVHVDIPTVKKVVDMLTHESGKKLKELDKLTMGLVTKPGARRSILEFLALEGIELPDLKKATVEDKLSGFELSEDMRRLLEIRKALSLTSTRKYHSFLARANDDDCIRDLSLYHGASTGRSGGTGINLYNFPRGLIRMSKDRPYATVENVASLDFEMLKVLYGDSLGLVFSAILRNMVTARPGYKLFVGDFSKVELVKLWWLARHEEGLDLVRSGRDPYRDQAAANTGLPYEEIPKDGNMRQLGKAQVLGCGFRMSWRRFLESAWDMYRLKLTKREAVDAVKSYREKHKPVVKLWDDYENAAVNAVTSGKPQEAGRCQFFTHDHFLWIELPSGRRLAYREPQIVMRAITYTALEKDDDGNDIEVEKTGKPKETIQFLGLDKSKKKLQVEFLHGGIITENITQGSARDLMMPAILRLEEAGYRVLLEVYDEGICERKNGFGSVEEFNRILTELPPWAKGLPLEAGSWSAERYRK